MDTFTKQLYNVLKGSSEPAFQNPLGQPARDAQAKTKEQIQKVEARIAEIETTLSPVSDPNSPPPPPPPTGEEAVSLADERNELYSIRACLHMQDGRPRPADPAPIDGVTATKAYEPPPADALYGVNTGQKDENGEPIYRAAAVGEKGDFDYTKLIEHTDYMSGASPQPPTVLDGFPETAAGAVSILSTANSVIRVAKDLGTPIPGDPCNKVHEFFGSLMTGGGKLSKVLDVLTKLGNLALNTLDLLRTIDNELRNLNQLINAEIERMKEVMQEMARIALAKALMSAIKDPCLREVIKVVGNAGVREALDHIPTPPPINILN